MPELSINDVVTKRSAWLLAQSGVTGFGVGESEGEPCIVVYVDPEKMATPSRIFSTVIPSKR